MKEIIIYLLKSGAVLCIFLLTYNLFLRQSRLFKFNRAFLLIGLVASFIIPAIKFSYNTILYTQPYISSDYTITSVIEEKSALNLWQLTFMIYITGILIFILKDLYSLVKLELLRRKSDTSIINGHKIFNNTRVKSPFSVFKQIFINTDNLSEIEKDLILKHEIVHIEQKHYWDLIIGKICLLLQWFNPFAWFYTFAQRENHEFLADSAVINNGAITPIYKAVLINQRFQRPVFSFSNGFKLGSHSGRLSMLDKSKRSNARALFILILLPLLGLYFWATAEAKVVIENPEPYQTENIIIVGSKKNKKLPDSFSGEIPIIKVDGKIISMDELNAMSTNDIDNISVIKNDPEYEKGIILITTKKFADTDNDHFHMVNESDTLSNFMKFFSRDKKRVVVIDARK